MAQVRRKIVDTSCRTYLQKAKEEGIKLSWNRFEEMLPQDGCGELGLYCHDCLQGPCRLNPLSQEEERTICGLTKGDMVSRTLYRMMMGNDLQVDLTDLDCGCEDNTSLTGLALCQIKKMQKMGGYREVKGITRQMGLGILKEDYINICLEEVTPVIMNMVHVMAEELNEEAVSIGARGYNIVVSGDISPAFPFSSVSNTGGVEFAVMTGLLDLYVVGKRGLGLGKNVIPHYHTVYAQADHTTCKYKVKDWLLKAADGYTKRDRNKILPSQQIGNVELIDLDKDMINKRLDDGSIRGICILGGGTNIKVTQDALICEAAVRLTTKGVLAVTYGNAAVTVGKYGYLQRVNDADPLVSCVGAELDVVKILEVVQALQPEKVQKVIALFPELTTQRDISVAFALAAAGVKVLTAINLPIDGNKEVAIEINKHIQYCNPTEYICEAVKFLGL